MRSAECSRISTNGVAGGCNQLRAGFTFCMRPSNLMAARKVWAFGLCAAMSTSVLTSSESAAAQLVFQEAQGHRVAELKVPGEGHAGFTLMAPAETGIQFTNLVPESRSLTNHILLNGSGVAAGDIDGDGLCDLFFSGIGGQSTLYRNLGGWKFQDITRESGLELASLDATGAVLADVDGDGDLDLLVTSIRAGVHLFLNDGKGRFQETTSAAGLTSVTAGMSLALADVSGNSRLDLYVGNYRNETLRDGFHMQVRVAQLNGKRVITMLNGRPLTGPDLAGWVTLDEQGELIENGQADILYRNDGGGKFSPLSFTSGVFLDEHGQPLKSPLYDWTLSAAFRDLNRDGAPDLYVCGDLASPDRIWINRGNGQLQLVRPTALRKTSWFSMGVDFADLNRDGYDEIFVADMVSRDHRQRQVQVSDHQGVITPIGAIENRPQVPRNTLFLNQGDGDYAEIGYYSGVYASDWSWSPVFLDVDLDGYEDLLIATGFERDVQDADIANQLETSRRSQQWSDAEALRMRAKFPRLELPKLAFRNRGDLTFEERSAAWGFNTRGVSQGMALADLDNDGDLDVIVNNMNGVAGIYRNESSAPRVAVRLKGQPFNTRGIGARIALTGGAVPRQSQEMQCGGRYLSSDDSLRVFAAGSLTNVLAVEVVWRSGKKSRLAGVHPNQLVEMVEPAGLPEAAATKPVPAPPIFEDVSSLVPQIHHEESFDDFARQPLLPRKLSQLGPGVAWFDLDGDGWDDLFIGSGKGGALGAFRNNRKGGFERFTHEPLLEIVARDQTTILGGQLAPGHPVMLAGSANYEDGTAEGGAIMAYDLTAGKLVDLIPGTSSSAGPIALADYDGDGALDLFVGGRVVPGRYPEPASSRLFRNDKGKLAEDASAAALLRRVGLVSGATWSDLDGDGFPELILACEWGLIRIFRYQDKREWHEITAELGFQKYRGWWNGVAAGDFDGDGRMDLVASNWGQNNKYQSYRSQPLRLYYGDFAESGGVDILEAYYDPAMAKIVPWQHFGRIGPAMPFVAGRYHTFREFSEASVEEILGEKARGANELQANWLESTVFLNRGDHFEAHPLPMEAQLSPAFALCVADIDNDGKEDLFISQNFFATEPETGRYDAGRGLWLHGDGHGGFRAMPASESGVRVYGEQRGAAVADFDHDGRVDLCVGQNGAPVRLFRNTGGTPGVKLRLRGPPGNPSGVGAQVQYSPLKVVKEVHAGSGYWSQDSADLIFPASPSPAEFTVRWPGGKVSTGKMMPGQTEVVMKHPDTEAK